MIHRGSVLGGVWRGRAVLALTLAGVLGLALLLPLRARAQGPAPLDATLFTASVWWTTEPDTIVRVVLERSGTVRAGAVVRADADGEIEARLAADGGSAEPILAGDRIGIHPDGATPFTRTVPVLSAAFDAATHTVSGRAPSDTVIEARVFRPDGQPVFTTQVASLALGVYALVLPASLVVDAGSWGTVKVTSGAGDRWQARWDVLTAVVTLGDPVISGQASLGSSLRASLQTGEGAAADSGAPLLVTGQARYALAFQRDQAAHAVAAGDRITLTEDDVVRLSAEVPPLSSLVDPERDRVTGRAPANVTVIVAVETPGGVIELPATADALGQYRADFADVLDITARTPVATYLQRGFFMARARGVREQVTATLHSAVLGGTAMPGTWVSANVSRRGDAGEQRGFGGATSGPDGRFELALSAGANGPPMPLLPGDRALVAFDSGSEPHAFVLPGLSATADPAADTVTGIALPFSEVEVTVDGDSVPVASLTATADAGGSFSANFAGRHDIRPGSAGAVQTELSAGDRIVLGWAVPTVSVILGEDRVAGFGPRGQAIALELRRAGKLVAEAAGMVDPAPAGGATNWSLVPRDAAGAPVPILGDDRLAVAIGGRTIDLEVPRLSAEANPAADFIAGTAVANRPVRVTIRRGGEATSAQAIALSDGRFTLGLAGRWNLEANDEIEVSVELKDGHTAALVTRAPGLSVQLERGLVSGYASPFAVVEASLSGGAGEPRAGGTTNASELGRFEIALADGEGRPVTPAVGDRLELRYAGQRIELIIPRLSVAIELLADRVSGRSEPGGEITVLASAALGGSPQELALAVPTQPDGSYRVDFAGELDLAAGSRVRVSYRGQGGHIGWIERRVPIVHAQQGGNLVSGWVAPEAGVDVRLRRAGRELASASAVAQEDGAFDVFLVDASGDPVALAGEDAVDLRWSGGRSPLAPASGQIQLALRAITATLDARRGRLVGRGPPEGTVLVHPGGLQSGSAALRATPDADGDFVVSLSSGGQPLPAGLAVEAGVLNAEGHRSYVRVLVPYLEVTLGSGRIAGQAAPLSPVALELDAGGQVRALGQARSDTFGHFEGLLRDPEQRPAAPASGDLLSLVEPGAARTSLRLPTLSIAIDLVEGALRGTGPANAPLSLRLHTRSRPVAGLDVWTNPQGAWSLGAAKLPAGIKLAELTQAEAQARVDNGHLVIAQAIHTPTPSPSPTGVAEPSPTRPSPSSTPTATRTATRTPRLPGWRVYLPWAYRLPRAR